MVDYSWGGGFAGRRLGLDGALGQGGVFFVVLAWLAFACCVIGLLALPLCGAALFSLFLRGWPFLVVLAVY
ncbi:hypothetical protein [Paraburkholderia sp. HD33-4]|uniref:hypothetical protein n=1 Tax=Paraburkholderia sp. HD33-4 TaxID=2883242 RepID=UPI001F15B6E7|nr:hypothetical protein [Paraburkholderia sp. HD33-4]